VADPGQNMFGGEGGPIKRDPMQHRHQCAGSIVCGEFGEAAVPEVGPPMEPVLMDQAVDPVPVAEEGEEGWHRLLFHRLF
jgi:hypothetical protein